MQAAPHALTPDVDVAILGTGFAGLGMAIKLKQEGGQRFVLLERADEVGGTWRDNHYPGAACDVPSHLYSLSYAPNTEWSRKYPSQPELYQYLRQLANDYGLYPHIRFGAELEQAEFDETNNLWRVRTSNGEVTARSLVMGSGGLAEPRWPDIPGVDRFKGERFHSSRWDHSIDLTGKRVAVVGSAASAIQLVPQIVDKAATLSVFQRTPNWIIPRGDRAYRATEKALFRRLPLARQLHRAAIYWGHEARVMGMVINPKLMTVFQKVAELHIRRQVKDPALRKQVTPDYTIGCRRVLISNDWYPALQRDNAELVTDGIAEITETGIRTEDGQLREVDVIIFATGFYATENPIAGLVHGRHGDTLASHWQDGEQAYLGTTVSGFPNLFMLVGPNTGLGHTSMVFMIEAQVEMVMKLLALRNQAGAETLEVKAEVQDRYNDKLQKRLAGSVWATGCTSWYQHRSGKITALWPGFTFEFWLRTRKVDQDAYRLG
ncbi:flavin-containing monooxygenase [Isoalcanivorax beigongshangi]|uniref:Flavin-containing monooxygenase n=1 Tax=Isoalcanivorax beigongshangi TaxID=3238810 RepID=A0ABV4AI64_9GAMM